MFWLMTAVASALVSGLTAAVAFALMLLLGAPAKLIIFGTPWLAGVAFAVTAVWLIRLARR